MSYQAAYINTMVERFLPADRLNHYRYRGLKTPYSSCFKANLGAALAAPSAKEAGYTPP
jgi:hypothetical protein